MAIKREGRSEEPEIERRPHPTGREIAERRLEQDLDEGKSGKEGPGVQVGTDGEAERQNWRAGEDT